MTNLTIKHITLIDDIERKVQQLEQYSASKQKRINELFAHGLVTLEEDEVLITDKARELIKSIEGHASNAIKLL